MSTLELYYHNAFMTYIMFWFNFVYAEPITIFGNSFQSSIAPRETPPYAFNCSFSRLVN